MKSVLVIDKSNDCGCCPCSGEEFGMCQAVNNEKECDYYNIPSWCPLKPLPEKRHYSDELADEKGNDMYMQGWNDCLDEITGESNG